MLRAHGLLSFFDEARNAGVAVFARFGFVLTASAIILFVFWLRVPALANENHLIENLQTGLLLLAAGLHLIQPRVGRGVACDPILRVLLAFLCLACALRELDIDKLGDAAVYAQIEFGLRAVTLGSLLIFIGVNSRRVWQFVRHPQVLWRTTVFRLTVAGIGFYLLSWPFDKGLVPLTEGHALFIEELLELTACAHLAAAAVVGHRLIARLSPASI